MPSPNRLALTNALEFRTPGGFSLACRDGPSAGLPAVHYYRLPNGGSHQNGNHGDDETTKPRTRTGRAARSARARRRVRSRHASCTPTTSCRGCRWTCSSAASISRASTCGPRRCRSWPTPSKRRAWCSRSSCVRWTRPEGAGHARYEIIAGERRWRAAQLAGLHEIPAIVRRVPDEAAIAMALIENIQRENLNPLEEARALDRLITEFDMTHATAAEAVGRSRAAVSNLLRLLELTDEVKTLVEHRELEMGHARALLGLESAAAAGRGRRAGREEEAVGARDRGAGQAAHRAAAGRGRGERAARRSEHPQAAKAS